jgi:hypothetical protein
MDMALAFVCVREVPSDRLKRAVVVLLPSGGWWDMFGCFIIDVLLRKQREAKNEAEQSNEKENGKSTDRLDRQTNAT